MAASLSRHRGARSPDLRAWMATHPGDYRREPQVASRQVFINPKKRGRAVARDAARLLHQLRTGDSIPAPRATRPWSTIASRSRLDRKWRDWLADRGRRARDAYYEALADGIRAWDEMGSPGERASR